MAYFGTGDPRAYGIDYRKVLFAYDFYPDEPVSIPRSGDYFACSVTLLQGLYWNRDHEFGQEVRARELVALEPLSEWVALRNARVEQEERYPSLADWLTENGHLGARERREVESVLLSTWLDHVREDLAPVGRAGDSIRIYRMP